MPTPTLVTPPGLPPKSLCTFTLGAEQILETLTDTENWLLAQSGTTEDRATGGTQLVGVQVYSRPLSGSNGAAKVPRATVEVLVVPAVGVAQDPVLLKERTLAAAVLAPRRPTWTVPAVVRAAAVVNAPYRNSITLVHSYIQSWKLPVAGLTVPEKLLMFTHSIFRIRLPTAPLPRLATGPRRR